MSTARREQLLRQIREHDQVLIEDDYDAEFNLDNHPLPALKASDSSGRVIYLSSLSKAFSPGLRIGYMVADAELIDELRALRRLMYRHPPLNNQRMLADFLAQGITTRTCGVFARNIAAAASCFTRRCAAT